MSKLTLEVPSELGSIMRRHGAVRWEQVAQRALWTHARKLQLAERLASRSRLSVDDGDTIGKEIKKALSKRYRRGDR
ncbi:MAG: hypothetical protein HY897_03740 [Deltaproteobacteria bacterium]|nr:hypothetical protein [Deltaproteobacteria bacterium]